MLDHLVATDHRPDERQLLPAQPTQMPDDRLRPAGAVEFGEVGEAVRPDRGDETDREAAGILRPRSQLRRQLGGEPTLHGRGLLAVHDVAPGRPDR